MSDVDAPPAQQPTASMRRAGLRRGEVVSYGLGNFAFSLLGLVVAVNLQYFYTDYVGLSAGLVAWSLLFARMFDAVTDPLMGWISDHTNTRLGRRRPWIVGSAIPLAIAFYFLFTPPRADDPAHAQTSLLAYLLALYIATYFIWTVGAVPYYSLGAEMSDDYHERVEVISTREGLGLIGLLVATILPAYLIYQFGGRDGYSFMGGILGAGTAIFLLISGVMSSERAEFRGRPRTRPYESWLATFVNPHFRRLLVSFFCSAVASTVPAVLVIYVAEYIIGTPQWWIDAIPGWLPTWSFYLLLYFIAGIASLPMWNATARRIGKRDAWAIGIVLAVLTSAGCWWLAEDTIGYFSLLLVFGGASFGSFVTLPSSMVADVIDFDEVGSGLRREGAYFAIWAFVTKLAGAVTGFCALQVLEHVGYVPGQAQTELVKTWMLWMYSWFPAALYGASLLALFRFKFTSADLAHVQRRVGRG